MSSSETNATTGNSITQMIDWNRGIFERVFRTTQEDSLDFLNRRLECNRRAIEKMRNANGLDGVLRAQQEWFADSTSDYLAQTERFGKRWLDVTEKASQEGAEQTRRGVDAFRTAAQREGDKAGEIGRQASHPAKIKTS